MTVKAAPITFDFDPYATLADLEEACKLVRTGGALSDDVVRFTGKVEVNKHGARVIRMTVVPEEERDMYGKHAA